MPLEWGRQAAPIDKGDILREGRRYSNLKDRKKPAKNGEIEIVSEGDPPKGN